MIYLDNCSTTEMREEVLESLYKALREDFGNPSSLHSLGFSVEKKMDWARDTIARFLGVEARELYFTSGGTEANNLAINSAIKKMRNRGNHLITTKIEHPSVLSVYKNLEQEGFRVSYLPVDSHGFIDLDELRASIGSDTILISVMHVNNEIGSIEPIREVREILDEKNRETLLHVDGVQGFGKLRLDLKACGVDMYSFSSHKVHGPKGVGGLYLSEKNKFEPTIFGGKQERGFRSGTENAPSIIAFGRAVEILAANFEEEVTRVKGINSYFRERLTEEISDIRINTLFEKSSPFIVNVSINNIRGEVLVHYLEQEEIYLSTSSACSSNDTKKSHVLESIGLNNKEIEGSMRICFSHKTSREDIDKTVGAMKAAVKEIRDIIMR